MRVVDAGLPGAVQCGCRTLLLRSVPAAGYSPITASRNPASRASPEANTIELAALLRESHWLPNWLPNLQTKSTSDQSGRRDLNPRPLDPQASS